MKHRSIRPAVAILLAAAAILSMHASVPGTSAATRLAGSTMIATAGWKAQASGTQQPLFSVSCFDASRCKAVGAGGTVLYTKNGGTTWRPQANPLSGTATILYRITCVGPSTCYVIGRPDIIMVTHNGGLTWSVHHLPLAGTAGQLTDPGCVSGQAFDLRSRPTLCRLGLLDLACLSATTCYTVATVSIVDPHTNLSSAMYLTTDGGSTWSAVTIPATAPCTGECDGNGITIKGFPYPLEWITCGPGSLCRAGGSIFVDSRAGYATLVIRTGKAAATWVPVQNSWYWPAPDSAVCPTASRCYGVWATSPFGSPGSSIFLSTDGGRQWNAQSSGSPKIRNAIACPGAATCYSVGNQGTITASIIGSPFRAQPSGTSHDLYGITCVGPTTCFAVGNKGTIVARPYPRPKR